MLWVVGISVLGCQSARHSILGPVLFLELVSTPRPMLTVTMRVTGSKDPSKDFLKGSDLGESGFFFFFLRQSLACCPGWNAVARSWPNAASASQVQVIVLSSSWVTGTTDMCHYTWLIFVFLGAIGFHHVVQASLELLTLSDLPALASQSAGITGVSHHARPTILYINSLLFT